MEFLEDCTGRNRGTWRKAGGGTFYGRNGAPIGQLKRLFLHNRFKVAPGVPCKQVGAMDQRGLKDGRLAVAVVLGDLCGISVIGNH